jgi:hypothetical protein
MQTKVWDKGNITTLITGDWISSFQCKLTFWTKSVESKKYWCFQDLKKLPAEYETGWRKRVSVTWSNIWMASTAYIFGLLPLYYRWRILGMKSTFAYGDTSQHVNASLWGFDRNYLWFHNEIKIQWTVRLAEFWRSILHEYPAVSQAASVRLLPFPTMYLCEVGFSRHTATKTKISEQATSWQEETPPFLTLMQHKKKHDILLSCLLWQFRLIMIMVKVR